MFGLNEKNALFIIYRRLYYYNVMPFALKKVRATYQRLVNKMFVEQIKKTMEVYVDDMLMNHEPHYTSKGHVQHPPKIQNEVESIKVCIQSHLREILGLHG